MSLQKLITNYAGYNTWAVDALVGYLRTKPEDTWYAEVPSSFNSIARTLNHILATQEFWYSVVTETENKSTRWSNTHPDAAELFDALQAHCRLLEEACRQYSEADLSQSILVETPWFNSALPRYEYLMHAINHSTYHRGQIITIGRSLGFDDAPNTDYNFYNVERLQAYQQ